VAACIHAFWLAARAYGLGVGWVSILEPAIVTDALDVPESECRARKFRQILSIGSRRRPQRWS
jgi:nitroreductase